MKKIALIIITTFLFLTVYSAPPQVHVTKWNGGWKAIFNLYDHVDWETTGSSGNLIISGVCCDPGYTRCFRTTGSTIYAPEDLPGEYHEAYCNLIDNYIDYTETVCKQRGQLEGSFTKVHCFVDSDGNPIKTYSFFVSFEYTDQKATTGSVSIYPTDISDLL